MYKVTKDPTTNRILSCTKISKYTPIYATDILLSESSVPSGLMDRPYKLTENGFEPYEETEDDKAVTQLQTELMNLPTGSDYEYFMKSILEGSSIEDARKAVKDRTEKQNEIQAQLTAIRENHTKLVKEYYIRQHKDREAKMNFEFYSAAILVIKDENKYLKEWLDWHLSVGFDHIYIYDNGVKEHVDVITSNYDEEKITVIDWGEHHSNIQEDAYNHFLLAFKDKVRWIITLDSDEFLRFADNSNVNDFLEKYEDYTEVWVQVIDYNANGQEHYIDMPVRERFTTRTDVKAGYLWKNFIQCNRIDKFIRHYAHYDPEKNQVFKNESANLDLVTIDHYYTKSWEEWNDKIKERGSVDPNYRKALSEFFVYNPDMEYLNTEEEVLQSYE